MPQHFLIPITGGGSLSMRGLRVPNQLILGQSALLGCDYDLEDSRLYSVKWYKDGKEFFRFMPSMEHKVQVFHVDGVSVDVRVRGYLISFDPVLLAGTGQQLRQGQVVPSDAGQRGNFPM